ncbi:MAG: S-methyl-5'-thioadenosine phosphorylase [Planctomycetes bacterium]|nr:S-methyl-5'-thioadenosine phosphorylase [Planctomycetota bacterium]MBI3835587.1 S-methyl-5'-thioadenosine phosphorylase [Planctomycetota bacterium]
MAQAEVGIIGGTGLGDSLAAETDGEPVYVDTPFGPPSSPPVLSTWEGVKIAFIARHGPGHRLNPSCVPYRANIWTLKKLGVSSIIASGATGSLREDIHPGELVICDQTIDRTFRRASTFFDEGIVAHVEFADPFCASLRSLLSESAANLTVNIHSAGTYVCMEGPQFSTRAESQLHRQMGANVIGMTCLPEAKLAREAEICYALVALPTDYDCWRKPDPTVAHEALLAQIFANLQGATQNAISLIREALVRYRSHPLTCGCRDALKLAIWSDKTRIDPYIRKRLDPLIGRYFSDV